MIKDKRLNLLRNYCFINFDDMIEANKALTQLNGKKLPNANFNFKLNWANQNSEGNMNLYIGNLSQEIDDIVLEEYTIKEVKGMINSNIQKYLLTKEDIYNKEI